VPLRQVLEASSVARDDRQLLARERPQRLHWHPPGLEFGEVTMLGEPALDRPEFGTHHGQQRSGVHTGIFNRPRASAEPAAARPARPRNTERFRDQSAAPY
jgi:hypothetical protein